MWGSIQRPRVFRVTLVLRGFGPIFWWVLSLMSKILRFFMFIPAIRVSGFLWNQAKLWHCSPRPTSMEARIKSWNGDIVYGRPLNKVGHVYTSLNTFLQVWTCSDKLEQVFWTIFARKSYFWGGRFADNFSHSRRGGFCLTRGCQSSIKDENWMVVPTLVWKINYIINLANH